MPFYLVFCSFYTCIFCLIYSFFRIPGQHVRAPRALLPWHGRADAVLLCGPTGDLPLRGRAVDARRGQRERAFSAGRHAERPGAGPASAAVVASEYTLIQLKNILWLHQRVVDARRDQSDQCERAFSAGRRTKDVLSAGRHAE